MIQELTLIHRHHMAGQALAFLYKLKSVRIHLSSFVMTLAHLPLTVGGTPTSDEVQTQAQ